MRCDAPKGNRYLREYISSAQVSTIIGWGHCIICAKASCYRAPLIDSLWLMLGIVVCLVMSLASVNFASGLGFMITFERIPVAASHWFTTYTCNKEILIFLCDTSMFIHRERPLNQKTRNVAWFAIRKLSCWGDNHNAWIYGYMSHHHQNSLLSCDPGDHSEYDSLQWLHTSSY